MWRMTLKQRRKHGELMAQLHALKKNPYVKIPPGYIPGEKPEEDDKYKAALDSLNSLVEEIYLLEQQARAGS
jgi:hypothetical protein